MMTLKLEKENEEDKCKGLFFRCERSTWVGSNYDINFKTKFKLLKRKSCSGCKQCDFLWDDIHEFLACADYNRNTSDPIIFDHAKHGKVYEMRVTNISTDWETGYVDDYDLELKECDDKRSA